MRHGGALMRAALTVTLTKVPPPLRPQSTCKSAFRYQYLVTSDNCGGGGLRVIAISGKSNVYRCLPYYSISQ